MTTAGTIDAPLDIFGGLVTDMAPADLPQGVSPDCADVKFIQGGVQTRPGLLSVFTALGGNPTVNYLKTYITLNLTQRLLVLDALGNLWKENPPGTLAAVASGLALNAYGRSATLFGREYLAISDGKFGADLPRQFDDANFDRVSQVGPAAGPTAADTIANIATIARNNNVVTVTTAAAHNLLAGDQVAIAGVTGGSVSFNGTFPVASITSATVFTYAQTAVNESGSPNTGTANPLGNIAPGAHQVSVIFKTRQGYLTRPSPPVTWTAAGSRRVTLTNIPAGPSNVIARVVAFTGAGGASFYYVGAGATLPAGNMIIADNTTTSAVLDFSDTTLLAATNVDYLFKLVELGECQGVMDYAQRLFWWGERNKANNWLNLTFDGGFNTGTGFPNGWTGVGAGGSQESALVAWGGAWKIIGDGVTGSRGLITQPAVKDSSGVALIAPNTDYSVRARVLKGGGLTQGIFHVNLFSTSGGINTTGLQVTATQAGTAYAEFIAQLTPPLTSIPSDLVLQVYADGTPTNGGFFVVDNIEIYPTNQPYNASLVRASRVEDPESYDGVNGILLVAENNGQAIRAAFRLRERLYFVKEHSLYVTEDDGTNEPALWSVSEVSRTVGTPSVNGVGFGEDWVVIADRSGLYLFWGPEPVKISQEIQPTWDSINWQYGHTIWVAVDTRNKRILVGVPISPATSPNRVLMMDYRGLNSAEEIAGHTGVHFSTFTGKLFAAAKARKWAPWFLTANSAALAERSDGTAQVMLGNGAGTGKIYQLSDTQFSDDGAAINSYYTTYFFLHHELEQALQTGSHRKLFAYLTAYVEGAGSLSVTAFIDSASSTSAQQPLALSNPGLKDLELPINVVGERVSFRVGTSAVGAWFKLQKFIASLRPDPWAPVRGVN